MCIFLYCFVCQYQSSDWLCPAVKTASEMTYVVSSASDNDVAGILPADCASAP